MDQDSELVASVKRLAYNNRAALLDYQQAVLAYAERLQAELEEGQALLDATEDDEDEASLDLEIEVDGDIIVPGATSATSLLSFTQLLSDNSPFREDALRRQRYLSHITWNPMRDDKELTQAVKYANGKQYDKLLQVAMSRIMCVTKSHLSRRVRRPEQLPERDNFLQHNLDNLDWEDVSGILSEHVKIPRNPLSVQVRWLGHLHPRFDHSPWLQDEHNKLAILYQEAMHTTNAVDWEDLASRLQAPLHAGSGLNKREYPTTKPRTVVACVKKSFTILPKEMEKFSFGAEDDRKLINLVNIYGLDNWNLVSRHFGPSCTSLRVQHRWERTLNPIIRKGPWDHEEDRILNCAFPMFPEQWTQIALFVVGRTPDQCRTRYNEKWRTGQWSKGQEQKLRELVSVHNDNWSTIAHAFDGKFSIYQCQEKWKKMSKSLTASESPQDAFTPTAHASPKRNTPLAVDDVLGNSPREVVSHSMTPDEDSTTTSSLGYRVFSLDGHNKKTRPPRTRRASTDKSTKQPSDTPNTPAPQTKVQFATSDMLMPPVRKRGGNSKRTKTMTATPSKAKRTKTTPKEPPNVDHPDDSMSNSRVGAPETAANPQEMIDELTVRTSGEPSSASQNTRPRPVPKRRSQRLKNNPTS